MHAAARWMSACPDLDSKTPISDDEAGNSDEYVINK